jgi:hypothetical protein
MAIIFTSITQFERQPERTKKRVKRDDLDTLTEVWVGPSVYEDSFVPRFGAVHPQYALMTVLNTSVKRLPGSVAEVTITYQGKLDVAGGDGYTSVPTISQSWSEGEVSYQVNTSIGSTIAVPGGGFSTVSQSAVATYSHRYTGRGCQVAYITNRRPTGNPTGFGLSKAYLGFTNEWDLISSYQVGAQVSGGGYTQKLTCTDVRIEDRADGWYRVTETYQSRMFPIPAVPIPDRSGGGSGAGISQNTVGGATGIGGTSWGAQEADAVKAHAAAVAAQAGGQLPYSTDEVGMAIYRETAMDPIWLQGDAAIYNAASANVSKASTTGVAQAPTPEWSDPAPIDPGTPLDY